MGAIADGILAYAQPLIDGTDGSLAEVNKALAITQYCFNLAIVSNAQRQEMIEELREVLCFDSDDDGFELFCQGVVNPMIERHKAMFPALHRRCSEIGTDSDPMPRVANWKQESEPRQAANSSPVATLNRRPSTGDRYAPCACGSGKKYKFCCGAKPR